MIHQRPAKIALINDPWRRAIGRLSIDYDTACIGKCSISALKFRTFRGFNLKIIRRPYDIRIIAGLKVVLTDNIPGQISPQKRFAE